MYVCIHHRHPFICNSNCWKHLISLACFTTFLTLKWHSTQLDADTLAQVEITHHCVIFWSLWPLTRSATYYGCIWQIFGKLTVRLLYSGLYHKSRASTSSAWDRKKVIKSYVKFAAVKTNITITTKNKMPLLLLCIRKWCRSRARARRTHMMRCAVFEYGQCQ